jgi:hypothetical protein
MNPYLEKFKPKENISGIVGKILEKTKIQPLDRVGPESFMAALGSFTTKAGSAPTKNGKKPSAKTIERRKSMIQGLIKQAESDMVYKTNREKSFIEDFMKLISSNNTDEVEKHRFAKAAERTLNKSIAGIMGPGFKSIKTSEFDDYAHGIDGCIEIDLSTMPQIVDEKMRMKYGDILERCRYIPIDFTTSHDTDSTVKKFNIIREGIDAGHLTKMTYFEGSEPQIIEDDPTSDPREPNERIIMGVENNPKVVLGMEMERVRYLMELLLCPNADYIRDKLQDAIIKRIVVEEIQVQLEGYRKHAQAKNEKDLALTFECYDELIKKILVEQEKQSKKNGEHALQENNVMMALSDSVFKGIQDLLYRDFEMTSNTKKTA